jgi:signal transduction histidine kinase
MIVIIDTGIGIPREFQYNILLPFNRFATLPDRQNGTALVLPLVKSLTELRGGRVELASVAGRSATITILLPQESRLVCKAAG